MIRESLTASPLRPDGLTDDHPRLPPLEPGAWGKEPLVRLVGWVGAAAVGFLLLFFASAAVPREALDRYGAPITALSLVVPAVLGYWLVCVALERRRPAVELAARRLPGLLAGLLAGLVLTALAVVTLVGLGGLRFDGTQTPAELAPLLWIAGLQAGLAEEVVFRGLILRLAEEWVGTWGAVAASALVFGVAQLGTPHGDVGVAAATALGPGLLLGALYVLTRNLWVVAGLHAAWNLAAGALFSLPVLGGTVTGWIRTATGPVGWLSGGPYGIGASPVVVALLLVAAVWALRRAARRGLVVAPAWQRRRAAAGEGDGASVRA